MNIKTMYKDYYNNNPDSLFSNQKRLKLIPLTENTLHTYLNDLWEYSKDSSFYKYLEYPPLSSIIECESYFKRTLSLITNKEGMLWIIVLINGGKAIGTIRLAYWDLNRMNTKIGYGISLKYCRQGYFSEALSFIIKYAFEILGFHRIESLTRADNIGSIKGLEKNGFKNEGCFRDYHLRYDGTRHDVDIFSLIKE